MGKKAARKAQKESQATYAEKIAARLEGSEETDKVVVTAQSEAVEGEEIDKINLRKTTTRRKK